jgi:ATP-dependent Clp protease ATP-binding subunit ClpA
VKGAYIDRRNNQKISLRDTIWVFATNLVDDKIQAFFSQYLEKKTEEEQKRAPFKTLQKTMRFAIRKHFKVSFLHVALKYFPS